LEKQRRRRNLGKREEMVGAPVTQHVTNEKVRGGCTQTKVNYEKSPTGRRSNIEHRCEKRGARRQKKNAKPRTPTQKKLLVHGHRQTETNKDQNHPQIPSNRKEKNGWILHRGQNNNVAILDHQKGGGG